MRSLKIKLQAPSAHYRIPHSSNPHSTYPVPPYSTVIGILCNILGDKDIIAKFLEEDFGMGMLSRYETLTREYVWYRNLDLEQHKSRYTTVLNRHWQERPDHPGGQSPVSVEVLNGVWLNIYLIHQPHFLQKIAENLQHSEKWLSHIHLGRSEDWAVPIEAKMIDLESSQDPAMTRNSGQFYQWLPRPEYCWKDNDLEAYTEFYKVCKGTVNLVSSKYKYVRPLSGELSPGSAGAIRNFSYTKAKVSCAPVPFLRYAFRVDAEEYCPVYFARIKGGC